MDGVRFQQSSIEALWLTLGCTSCRQQDLFRVLKAYTVFRPEEGYCQGQAPVAAVLLMHMPAEVRTLSISKRKSENVWNVFICYKMVSIIHFGQTVECIDCWVNFELFCRVLCAASFLVLCTDMWKVSSWILQHWAGELSCDKNVLPLQTSFTHSPPTTQLRKGLFMLTVTVFIV